jgi:DNA-binding response OmpR family regulator
MDRVVTSITTGRILIADDEDTFLRATADLLRAKGFAVETAVDSASAAQLLRNHSFDVVILDVNMSGNVRLEFLAGLHSTQSSPPVILVSGYPTIQVAAAAVGFSVLAYLIKPFEFDVLLQHIHDAVRRSKVQFAVGEAQNRLRDWDRDLKLVSEALAATASGTWKSATETFSLASLHNIIATLSDLKRLIDAQSLYNNAEPKARELLGCPPPLQLMQSIRHTIEVLERTKGAFKSKELGDLRQSLEAMMSQSAVAPKLDK